MGHREVVMPPRDLAMWGNKLAMPHREFLKIPRQVLPHIASL